jgi:hypothetical protein
MGMVWKFGSKGDGVCRCQKTAETSRHVLHECRCDANSLGREQMAHKTHGSIRGLMTAGAISPDWGWFLTQVFALDKDGATEMWDKHVVPEWALWSQQQSISSAAKNDILVWVRMGSECLWKGLFPVRFTATLRCMGMPAKVAEKWSGNLRDWLLDGATAIWRLRCKEVNDGKLPDSEATTRLRECAVELWRNMESEIPPDERAYREVSPDQINSVPPHKLRALVRSLEDEMRTRRKPVVTLRLTRQQIDTNPLYGT